MTTDCGLCSRPMGDQAYVCSLCAGRLRTDLLRIMDLAGEVEAAIAKLTRFRVDGGGSGGRPLPVDLGAASQAAAVGNTVSTWARHVAESRGVQIPRLPARPVVAGPLCYHGRALSWFLDAARPRPCVHDSCEDIRPPRPTVGISAAARFLVENVEWLRHQPEAAEALDELRDASSLLERLLGGPSPRWYAGPCRAEYVDERGADAVCEADLYAAPGARTVRCRDCGTEYDAQARKEWLLDEAMDALVHAELMARALTALGVGGEQGVTAARVRGMARHGRLLAKGINLAGDATYRVGDVLAVIEEQEAIEADRVAKRQAKAARRAEKTDTTTVVDSATISAHDRSAVGEVSPESGGPRLSRAG